MGIWKKVSNTGVKPHQTLHQQRSIVLSNRVSAIVSGFTLILSVLTIVSFGFIYSGQLALLFTAFFLLPILLNSFGFINASRVLLSIMLSLASLIISVIDKLDYFQLEEFQYFEFRLTQLIATIFPFILFKLKELAYWLITLSFNFITILLFDPIHNFFNVGYYQLGFSGPNYYFLNYMVVATFMVIAVSTYFLKKSFENSEHENELLIETLNHANGTLLEKGHELILRQKELLKANDLIHEQRELLSKENSQLSRELIEKNNQLMETNAELINHNNDLQQFSYSISHNLKGPVASITGLINLFDLKELGANNQPLMDHLQLSLKSLDTTIKDLNNIIDIRNKVSKLRQRLLLRDEAEHIHSLLKKEIDDHQVSLIYDFSEVPVIYSVKPMVHSILYNLVSNAIKYRHPDRVARIQLSSHRQENMIRINVSDNGLGIDLDRFGEKVFGLYKRFHVHTEGKGLGLFLVKLQTEALGGSIKLKSMPEEGTTFSIHLPMPEEIGEQVLLDNDLVKVYFDASIDTLINAWKRDHTAEEFKHILTLSVDFLRTYRTPNWISDIRKVPHREEDELNVIRKKAASDLMKAGLRRIAAVIHASHPQAREFVTKKEVLSDVYPFPSAFFTTFEDAVAWIRKENDVADSKHQTEDLPFQ